MAVSTFRPDVCYSHQGLARHVDPFGQPPKIIVGEYIRGAPYD